MLISQKGGDYIRSPVFILIAIAALALLLVLGWYFGHNFYKIFVFRNIKPRKIVFWLVLAAVVVAAIYTRSILLATLLYGTMLFALGDVLRLAVHLTGRQAWMNAINTALQGGLTLLALAAVITFAAWLNARNPVLTSYEVQIDKDFGALASIEIIMLADLHLGTATDERSIDRLVQNVNAQNPDVVALCGDLFDEGTTPELRAYAISAFGQISSRYGVYCVTGNHDSTVSAQDRAAWSAANVTLLLDERVLVDDSFYLLGLSDAGHRGDSTRGSAVKLLAAADHSKPVILLDHRPGGLESARDAGVDLQLSGHTHSGQLFPFSGLAARVNKVGYGHETFDDFHIVVTSGYSVWGLPARLGSPCEYVRVSLVPAE